MRYYLIAGEASGDLHGSNLMKALRAKDPDASFRYWGGDLMQAEGGTLVRHIDSINFMGFWEVLKNGLAIFSAMRMCRRDIASYRPDALVLIDYPGFNLRMAKYASTLGIRVFYYISPKVWAWNSSRVKTIKRYVDHMLAILPFETDFYRQYGYEVDYVGNPVADAVEARSCRGESAERFMERTAIPARPIIAVLPGSRLQEIHNCLPVMLSLARHFEGYQLVVAGAPSVGPSVYRKYTGDSVPVLFNETYALLQQSAAAMVVSGTATLEAALLGVPMVVCYRGSWLSYQIARRFVRVRYISLVNLIMEREVVRELIQEEMTADNIAAEMKSILFDAGYRHKMLEEMKSLEQVLGGPGASGRAAEKIAGCLGLD